MDSKPEIPKKCITWKDTAFNACNAMEEPTICKDITLAIFSQCVKWEQQKKENTSVNKKNL